MVLPDSDRITRVPPYSGTALVFQVFGYGPITLYGQSFQTIPLTIQIRYEPPHNPREKFPLVWAIPISLAATFGISFDFYSYRYLDVSVPCVRSDKLCIHLPVLPKKWVSPFGDLRIKACLAAPRRISQLATSFIAS